jgi:hypothetical protein
MYGQPVPLNYNGEDTYKTTCGAAATIAMIVFTVLFLVFKIEHFNSLEMWTLSQQTVHVSEAELNTPLPFGIQSNLSIALQFRLKKTASS